MALFVGIDVSKAMMIAFVTPLVAVFVGSFFGEKLEIQTLFGGLLILASIGLIVFGKKLTAETRRRREKK